MIKKEFYIVFFFFICFQMRSQSQIDSIAMNFHLEFDKTPLELNKKYVSANKDTLTIQTFRCYIGNIKIQYLDNSVFVQKDYHLLDFENPSSFRIPLTQKTNKLISKIIFDIGIDSLTNTSGAMAGDLDPTKGMYWAWQSGYINMKIEGKSSSCKTRKNEFLFHIGGYLQPYYSMRTVVISNTKYQTPTDTISIAVDLGKFFSEIHLITNNSIMISGKEAMILADLSAKIFFLK